MSTRLLTRCDKCERDTDAHGDDAQTWARISVQVRDTGGATRNATVDLCPRCWLLSELKTLACLSSVLLLLLGCSGGDHQAHELVDGGPDASALQHIGRSPNTGPATLRTTMQRGATHRDAGRRPDAQTPDAGEVDETADAGTELDAAVSDAGHDAGTHHSGSGGAPPCMPAFQCQ